MDNFEELNAADIQQVSGGYSADFQDSIGFNGSFFIIEPDPTPNNSPPVEFINLRGLGNQLNSATRIPR